MMEKLSEVSNEKHLHSIKSISTNNSHNEFDKLVKQLKTDHYTKHFKPWNLMTVLITAQTKGRDNLRHIVTSLRHHKNTWAHLGIKGISKPTLADGNSRVNSALFEQLFYMLLKKTQVENRGIQERKKNVLRSYCYFATVPFKMIKQQIQFRAFLAPLKKWLESDFCSVILLTFGTVY